MKFPIWATALTLVGIIILCTLGTWQLQRLTWKNDIIAKLDAAYTNPLTQFDIATIGEDSFTYITTEGVFRFDKSILLGYSIKDEKPGQTLITPLETKQGTLLINMGWNPQGLALDTHFLKAYNGQKIRFTGLLRKPNWNSFTPQNVPEENIWYRPDIPQIAMAKDLKNPIPMVLYADFSSQIFKSNEAEDVIFPSNTRWEPDNNHQQYAYFWFAMALALAVIYALRFLRRNNSER